MRNLSAFEVVKKKSLSFELFMYCTHVSNIVSMYSEYPRSIVRKYLHPIRLSPSDPSNYNPSFLIITYMSTLDVGWRGYLIFISLMARNLSNPILLARRVGNSLGSSLYKPFPARSVPSFCHATTRGVASLTRKGQ